MDFESLLNLHVSAGGSDANNNNNNEIKDDNEFASSEAFVDDGNYDNDDNENDNGFTIEDRLGGALNASRDDNDGNNFDNGRHNNNNNNRRYHNNRGGRNSSRGRRKSGGTGIRFGPGCGKGSATEIVPGTIEFAEIWGDYPSLSWRDHWHTADQGNLLILFECKAEDNIVVCLSPIRGIPDDKIVYEIVLGGWKNTKVSFVYLGNKSACFF